MSEIGRNFLDQFVTTDAKARKALEALKNRVDGLPDMELLNDLAAVGRYAGSQELRDLTTGSALVIHLNLQQMLGACRTRLAQVMRQKPTKANQLTVERLGSVVNELTRQSIKTLKIMLEADGSPRERRRGRG